MRVAPRTAFVIELADQRARPRWPGLPRRGLARRLAFVIPPPGSRARAATSRSGAGARPRRRRRSSRWARPPARPPRAVGCPRPRRAGAPVRRRSTARRIPKRPVARVRARSSASAPQARRQRAVPLPARRPTAAPILRRSSLGSPGSAASSGAAFSARRREAVALAAPSATRAAAAGAGRAPFLVFADLALGARRRAAAKSPPISATAASPASVGCGASARDAFAGGALRAAPTPAPAPAAALFAFAAPRPRLRRARASAPSISSSAASPSPRLAAPRRPRPLPRSRIPRPRARRRSRRGGSPARGAASSARTPRGGLAALDRVIVRAGQRIVRLDRDGDAEAAFEIAQMRALLVEDVERDGRAGAHRHVVRGALDQRVLEHAQHVQRDGGGRAHDAGAHAMRAHDGRAFEHAGADALARHFQQAEMRDAADLDARAVVLQRVLHAPLDRAIVAPLLHVDEVDDDEAGEVAQAKLAGDFVGRLEIGAQRRVLDIVLARRAARVDVDGDQRLGLVDDDVAARLQRHLVGEHRVELRLDAGLGEHRLACRGRARRT